VRQSLRCTLVNAVVAPCILLLVASSPSKGRPVSLHLPDTDTAADITQAQAAILRAVAAGDLLPGEAATPDQHSGSSPQGIGNARAWTTHCRTGDHKMRTALERRLGKLEDALLPQPVQVLCLLMEPESDATPKA